MVSEDPWRRMKRESFENPISFDGVHTYQLIIKSRALDYLAAKQNNIRQCRITRIKVDGSTEYVRSQQRYAVAALQDFSYRKESVSHIRFDGSIEDSKGVDLLKVYSELKALKPSTLYIVEMDIKTETGIELKFASRQMKMKVVADRIDKSKSTTDSPLVLRHIYNVETLRQVRKEHLGRKLSFILVGEKATKEGTVYSIMGDNNGDS